MPWGFLWHLGVPGALAEEGQLPTGLPKGMGWQGAEVPHAIHARPQAHGDGSRELLGRGWSDFRCCLIQCTSCSPDTIISRELERWQILLSGWVDRPRPTFCTLCPLLA